MLQILERLEIELDELLVDAHIARTASGSLFESKRIELDPAAVLYVTDHLNRGGYLKAA